LRSVAVYITSMLRMFGVIEGEELIGFPLSSSQGASSNTEELVLPYLSAFADFRENVRKVARRQKEREILELCDSVRDDVLPNLGVRLEDKEGQSAVIKLVDREILMKEREEKIQREELLRKEKEAKAAAKASQEAAKEALRRLPPGEMFRAETDKYSKFDEKGLPTHDALGVEISKSQLKKLQKLYEAQDKLYQDFLKQQQPS